MDSDAIGDQQQGAAPDMAGDLTRIAISQAADAIKDRLASAIRDHGEQYVEATVERIRTSAAQLAEWSRRNPAKAAMAVTAFVVTAAFIIMAARKAAARGHGLGDGGIDASVAGGLA